MLLIVYNIVQAKKATNKLLLHTTSMSATFSHVFDFIEFNDENRHFVNRK